MATASNRGWPINPTTVRVPCPGIPLNMHPAVAPLFAELIRRTDAIKGHGFMKSSGGKNVRAVRGYEERYKALLKRNAAAAEGLLSNHSWALAADFRAGSNPQRANGPTDMPANIVVICRDISPYLVWGGTWSGSRRDPMHFEYLGTPANAAADVARLTAPKTTSPTINFLEDLVAQMPQKDYDEFMRFVNNYNRTWDLKTKSKAKGHENDEVWQAEFDAWTEANTARSATASEALLAEQRKTNDLLNQLLKKES